MSNGLTESANSPSSSWAPVFSERIDTPPRSLTSGPSLDRKSGSAGMPRPTPFPRTTLFRSDVERVDRERELAELLVGAGVLREDRHPAALVDQRPLLRSEERVSRNAQTDPLSPHDALPI